MQCSEYCSNTSPVIITEETHSGEGNPLLGGECTLKWKVLESGEGGCLQGGDSCFLLGKGDKGHGHELGEGLCGCSVLWVLPVTLAAQ